MIRYRQIRIEEREKIYELLKTGKSYRKIAEYLGRNKSSISREVSRNGADKLGYLPDRANNLALERRNKLGNKIERYPKLKSYIIERLSDGKWSPEIISGRIKKENKLPNISHESIYKYIYSRIGLKLKLYQHLMYARPTRQLKYSRRKRYVPDIHKIINRPERINNRQEFGHFEADLTFFKNSRKGNLAVLVERLSRKSFIIKNNNKRSIPTILNLLKIDKTLPAKTIKSITFDNGGEFKQFGLLAMRGTKVFFCDPGAPYQKGQVERTNAILHKFIPKKSNFHSISDQHVHSAQEKLNNLPRKCLNFLTPHEAWFIHSSHTVALQS
jgi:IS30 family transposase